MPDFAHTPGQPCCDVCLCSAAEDLEGWDVTILGLILGGSWGETVDCERTGSDCEQITDSEWYDHTISGEWIETRSPPLCFGCSVTVDGFESKYRTAKRIKLWYSVGVTVTTKLEPCVGGVRLSATVNYDILMYWGMSNVQQFILRKIEYSCATGLWGTPPDYPDPLGSFDPPTPVRPCTTPWATTGCPSLPTLPANGCTTIEEDTNVTYRYVMSGFSCAVGNSDGKLRTRTSEACCNTNNCAGATRTTRVQLTRTYESDCVPCGSISSIEAMKTDETETDEIYSLLPHLNWCNDFPSPPALNLTIPWKLVFTLT